MLVADVISRETDDSLEVLFGYLKRKKVAEGILNS